MDRLRSPERSLRRSDQNAKNKIKEYSISQVRRRRDKGSQQCVKFYGEARLRTEKCPPLDLATKTSIVTLLRVGLVNRCVWNQTVKSWA